MAKMHYRRQGALNSHLTICGIDMRSSVAATTALSFSSVTCKRCNGQADTERMMRNAERAL